MREHSVNYFWGSVFSTQIFYAYGIAGGVTTLFQMLLVWLNIFTGFPTRTERLPVILEAYIETLIPLWIPRITGWNILIFFINILLSLWVIYAWTAKYDKSIR